MKKQKRKVVLLESASAGRVLDVSPAQVRKMADQGLLPIEATTPRGGRLFRADAVERLRRQREAVRATNARGTRTAGALRATEPGTPA